MTGCADRELAIQALVDGELDGLNAAELEAHLRDCPACAEAAGQAAELRALFAEATPAHEAPPALRQRVAAMIDAGDVAEARYARQPRRLDAWFGGGALGALVAALALVFAAPQLTSVALQDELIAGHIRSLQAGHLVDVATSDRHVVKPWYNGRLDFAPPVVELAPSGFPLVGGRLDYVQGRPVAALVYRRRLHSINLFIRPASATALPIAYTSRRTGYALIHWTSGGLEFWAVSDVEPADLQQFRAAFRQTSGS